VRHVLALDQGTTSSRAIVFDEHGAIRGFAQHEVPQHFPNPGWVEHAPEDIWHTQLETARTALTNAGIAASDVAALGITNQRETTIVWERDTGRPIARAIVWQDRRTAPHCEALRERGLEPLVRAKTGLILDPYFSATKIGWLLDNVAGARMRAERGELAFGTVDSWLVFNLTGGVRHVTDHTNAARTLLFDLQTLAWDDELLQVFEIPRSLLPEVLPSMARFGETLPGVLGAAVPIAGIAGDQQAALVGQAGFQAGLAKCTFGTGAFVMLNTGHRVVHSEHGLLSTVAFSGGGERATYALEGAIFSAGATVQWLRDGLAIIATAGDVENLANRVPDSGGLYLVPAFVGLGAPHWDPYARGTLFGLTRGSTAAHVARAALEAMAFQTLDVVRAMERDAGLRLEELRVDGGAAASDIAMQFQADVLECDVVRPGDLETSARGAAYLAGLGAGVWRDEADVARHWHEARRFKPALDRAAAERIVAGWRRAVERTLHWLE
jgi:glycerol kinase